MNICFVKIDRKDGKNVFFRTETSLKYDPEHDIEDKLTELNCFEDESVKCFQMDEDDIALESEEIQLLKPFEQLVDLQRSMNFEYPLESSDIDFLYISSVILFKSKFYSNLHNYPNLRWGIWIDG